MVGGGVTVLAWIEQHTTQGLVVLFARGTLLMVLLLQIVNALVELLVVAGPSVDGLVVLYALVAEIVFSSVDGGKGVIYETK
jgi:hypothetical protein